MQDCLCDLEGIRSLEVLETCPVVAGLFTLHLFFLLKLKFFQMVAFNFLEVVVSTEYDLLASEAHTHWVCCQHYFLDSLWTISFHASYQKV